MRKFYVIMTVLVACFATVTVNAKQLSLAEAVGRLQQTSGKHNKVQSLVSDASMLDLAYTGTEGANNYYYVVNNTMQKSSLVISADDCAPALLAVMDGEFDPNNIPSNVQWWLNQYERAIKTASSQQKSIAKASVSSYAPVDPLLTCQWNQSAPFNNQCPDVTGGGRSVTGCVATAMAQVMYYHKWPEQGVGSHSYSYNLSGEVINVSANFNTTYNWSAMHDTQAMAGAEEAKLMFHCGVSVDMLYRGGASSASSSRIPNALITYFGYDKAISRKSRVLYTDDQWATMLLDELAARRPVIYSGRTKNDEGHAFVIDGYDGTDFHVNWGWGGYCDGYFTILGESALNPNGSGIGGGTAGMGYSLDQDMIIGIQKAKEGSSSYIEMTASSGYSLVNGSLSPITESTRTLIYVSGGIYNTSINPISVEMGLMLQNVEDEGVIYYCGQGQCSDLEVNSGYSRYSVSLANVMKNGTYNAYAVFRPYGGGDNEWQKVQTPPTFIAPQLTVTGDQPSLYVPEPMYVNIEKNITTKDLFKVHVKLQALQNVSNQQVVAFVFPIGGGYNVDAASKSITMYAGEVKEFVFDNWQNGLSGVDLNEWKVQLKMVVSGQYVSVPNATNSTAIVTVVNEMPEPEPEPNYANVTFVVDGTSDTQNLEVGTVIPTPTSPTKEGYTFTGWNPAFVPGTTVPAGGITYTAQWQVNKYNAYFRVNGVVVDTKEIEFGGSIEGTDYSPEDPNTVITGWTPDGSYTTMPAHDIYFDAIVQTKVCITFDVDGTETEAWLFAGEPITPPSTPVKEGYTFKGWGDAYTGYAPSENVKYEAQWEINTHVISYIYNGEVVEEIEVEYNGLIPDPDFEPTDGNVIKAWTVEGGYTTMPDHDIKVIASVEGKIVITFVIDGETVIKEVVPGTTIEEPEQPVREGYTFTGWSPEFNSIAPATDVIYTATWSVNSYKVTYVFNGQNVGEYMVEYGAAIPSINYTPEDSRYTITGWTSDADYDTMPAKDIVFVADFTDGIDTLVNDMKRAEIYTVNGVRVSTLVRGNIYIINGKKMRY